MSPIETDPATRERIASLGPYARFSLERAARYALRLHAEEVTREHLLASLLEDESCAATLVVLHAFADPATIGIEILALSPGIMVVGSKRCLPFSVLGVRVLLSARARAAEHADTSVTPDHLFATALAELPEELLPALRSAGFEAEGFELPELDERGEPVPADGPLLKRFSNEARRALAAACRAAGELGREEISPAHVVLGCLVVDDELCARTGLTAVRARLALAGRDLDTTPTPDRALAPDQGLLELVAALPSGAGTADILARLVTHGSAEVRALLERQQITPALVERARGAFEDPDPPESASI